MQSMDPSTINEISSYLSQHLDTIPFKTLQRGELEASAEQKLSKMQDLLQRDPGLFLSRWGRFLPADILCKFEPLREKDYEVAFFLDQYLARDDQKVQQQQKKTIHNRRYEYLKRHLRGSDYFSDESMQRLDPVLYKEFVGQYKTEEEMAYGNDVGLVQRILSNIDQQYAAEQVQKQKEMEDEQFEEEEEEEDEEDVPMKDTTKEVDGAAPMDTNSTLLSPSQRSNIPLTDDDIRDMLPNQRAKFEDDVMEAMMEFREGKRQELIRLMEERFLAGKDTDFDYTKVDFNETYDDLKQQEQDIHDRYFEEESDEEGDPTRPSEYTGILDY